MKEVLERLLINCNKRLLVYLVIGLSGLVARYWYSNYKEDQQDMVFMIKSQIKQQSNILVKMDDISGSISGINTRINIMNMKMDTLANTQSEETKKTLRMIDQIYQCTESPKIQNKNTKVDAIAGDIISTNNELINKLKIDSVNN